MLCCSLPFLGKHVNAVHSNEVQIMNVEIGEVVQKTNRSAYNQIKGSGFPEFLLMIMTNDHTGLLRYRLNFYLCQYIYCLFLTVFCHRKYCQILGQGK